MPKLQNFSVPATNDATLNIDVSTDISGETLDGATVYWRVYEQVGGVPVEGSSAIIEKSSPDDGIVVLPSPPMNFTVTLNRTDLAGLLGNYYHEATVVDEVENHVTVMCGLMTVTMTENVIS